MSATRREAAPVDDGAAAGEVVGRNSRGDKKTARSKEREGYKTQSNRRRATSAYTVYDPRRQSPHEAAASGKRSDC